MIWRLYTIRVDCYIEGEWVAMVGKMGISSNKKALEVPINVFNMAVTWWHTGHVARLP